MKTKIFTFSLLILASFLIVQASADKEFDQCKQPNPMTQLKCMLKKKQENSEGTANISSDKLVIKKNSVPKAHSQKSSKQDDQILQKVEETEVLLAYNCNSICNKVARKATNYCKTSYKKKEHRKERKACRSKALEFQKSCKANCKA